ncbi:putative amastin [Trypanosoma rangeli]|uniref:Putative amastin n=1 Tax=Trypanosoma rangeli TaxID=5698 RepID=A0A3R7JV47_TRYRA|nr:putative amastin [Trypanosoma rangeli]RNE97311.1 putative amastin [Trypanosoma rangeli]|eukprot:RNE97311.1 putative amastin [Trypanosoma rangeli]
MDGRTESSNRTYAEASSREEERGQQQSRDVAVSSTSKWCIVGVLAAALLCEMVCWVMSACTYTSRYCENKALPRTTTYGVGFGLLMAGWTVGLIALVLFVLVV